MTWPVLEMTAGIQYAWYAVHLDVVSALAFFLFTIAMAQALESQDMTIIDDIHSGDLCHIDGPVVDVLHVKIV